MNTVYEHIVAILVVGVIFVGAVVALPAAINANLATVDQQQIRNTATNVFDSMLLNVGSPPNWGSILLSDSAGNRYYDPNVVTKFGLAYADPFSKYVLDPDKVQRLNPSEISYERVRNLLQLEDYGFKLTIARPFRVAANLSVTDTSVHYSVSVWRTEDGTPIPNAGVKVTTMVTAKSTKDLNESIYQPIPPAYNTTNVVGNCQGTLSADFGDYAVKYAVAIIEITVAGMSTTIVTQNDASITQYIDMKTYGDNVLLSIRNSSLTPDDPGAEREILSAVAYDNKNLIPILSETEKITWGKGYQNVTMLFPGIRAIHPTVLLMVLQVNLRATPGVPGSGGPTLILVAGPFSFADSGKIFEFGGDSTSRNPIVTMRRLVVISDMTYVAGLSFWRE